MNIIVYTTQMCPYCVHLKEFLKEHEIEFTEIDVSQDQKAAKRMVEKTRQMGVPVTEIDNEFVVGFDKEKLEQKLNIK